MVERRLNNVVYRLGWAPTRAAARQLVVHEHVLLNDRKMNVPSYSVKVNDVVKLKDNTAKIPMVAELLKEEAKTLPGWLDRKATIAKIQRFPEREDVTEVIDEQLVVEFYSR